MSRRVSRGSATPFVVAAILLVGAVAIGWSIRNAARPDPGATTMPPVAPGAARIEGASGSPEEIAARWRAASASLNSRDLPVPVYGDAAPVVRAFTAHLEALQRDLDRGNHDLAAMTRESIARDFLELRAVLDRHGLK